MKLESINIIHTLIIWQSLLFAIVLLTPKYIKKQGNKFLALFLLTLGIHFIYNILLTNNLFLDKLPQYSCSYGFLYGPLLFFYVKSHFRKDLIFKPLYFLHFLPFAIVISLTINSVRICNIAMYWIIPTMMFYCLLSFLEVNHYKRVVYQVSSNRNTSETKWINTLLILMLIVLILNLVQMKIAEATIFDYKVQIEHIVQIGILVLVNIITYQGLKNPHFFLKISAHDLSLVQENKSKEKAKTLNNKALNSLAERLKEFMEFNKPYLNPELDLSTLAEELNVHPKMLSLAINHVLGYNFSEYINSQRILAAELLLKNNSDQQLTIMEVMYDVGFNSRSVFNTLFKKKIGLTPSQYKSQQKNNSLPNVFGFLISNIKPVSCT